MAQAGPSGKPDRLFVGNLSPNVDEYTLVQVFSKFGTITKLDLMIHKTGPLKGKPRGYAFVEYASKDDALKALVKLHDRLLRGRKLVVTYANAAPQDDGMFPKSRRVEANKPTTLSLLKQRSQPKSTEAQIAAMEAKLAAMSKRPDRSPTPERIATENLEAEIQRELAAEAGPSSRGSAGPSALEDRSRAASEQSPPPSLIEDVAKVDSRTGSVDRQPSADSEPPQKHTGVPSSLPPRPPSPHRDQPRDKPTPSKTAFERGLASLPKKPTF